MNSTELAKFMHEEYEKIAAEKGWKTQKKSKVSFDKLPIENKETMIELAERISYNFEEGRSLKLVTFFSLIIMSGGIVIGFLLAIISLP